MTVFLACLIATSNLQICNPLILALSKGKSAMAALLAFVSDEDVVSSPPDSTLPTFPKHRHSRSARLSKPRPGACLGRYSTSRSHRLALPHHIQLPTLPNAKRQTHTSAHHSHPNTTSPDSGMRIGSATVDSPDPEGPTMKMDVVLRAGK